MPTLAQVVRELDRYEDELTIWARARRDLADLTPESEVVVAPPRPDDATWWPERGLVYVLEVELARDAIDAWRQAAGDAEPSDAQRCAAVVHYVVYDAYLPVEQPWEPAEASGGAG